VSAGGPILRQAYWAADESVSLVDSTVGGLLAERADSHADRLALVGVRHDDCAEVRLSFAELYDEAGRVATALCALAERGSYIAIWAPNVVEWPIIQYGAALAGMVLVAFESCIEGGRTRVCVDAFWSGGFSSTPTPVATTTWQRSSAQCGNGYRTFAASPSRTERSGRHRR